MSEVVKNKKSALVERIFYCLVGPAGFEPTYTEPKSVVLPLDDGPNFPSKGSANIITLSFYANGS